ncbi:MAG TPA: MBL fold metallo-hydrolase [Marmoricola sp.]|nr:MBL fold metallo-hydrolase [Marmoricola sp.]HNN47642.1 MBL fold metallo-hydrolase [Marmoricola sp.]HNO40473.1 MBL fold metallo-hydrolase [Marmoricola sp.]
MRLTKFGHACIRVESGDAVIVIDPGVFTEPEAVADATDILITHEHPDHWSSEHLLACDARIFTIQAVADQIAQSASEAVDRLQVVSPGDRIHAGVPVQVIGEKHAIIYRQLPHFDNSGFLLDLDGRKLFHPGDALTVPDQPIDLLCLPVSAPWLKISECIDYARAVAAPRSVAIHDMIYSQPALDIAAGHLSRFLEPDGLSYERIEQGQDFAI